MQTSLFAAASPTQAKRARSRQTFDDLQIGMFAFDEDEGLFVPAVEAIQEENEEILSLNPTVNYRITAADRLGQGSLRNKAHDNLRAIRILKQVREESRCATPEEQAALVRYVGWGGLAQIFDHTDGEWPELRKQLYNLLGGADFEKARESVINAHFTPEAVIRGIYEALKHLGFEGGNVLEPAAGNGHFIGLMPEGLSDNTDWTAIELDPTTAGICELLYPSATVLNCGYQDAFLSGEGFDLVIGNVPFGQYPVYDPVYNPENFTIHNYFFLRSLAAVRPGGVIAMLTSRFTMDAENRAVRKAISEQADLIGAIRLPEGAFKENANTEVVTDLLILRKRSLREKKGGENWLNTQEIELPIPGAMPVNGIIPMEKVVINEYYAKHPEMVVGNFAVRTSQHGLTLTVKHRADADLQEEIRERAEMYLSGEGLFGHKDKLPKPVAALTPDDAFDGVHEGGFVIVEGELCVRQGNSLAPHGLNSSKDVQRVKMLVKLRDQYDEVLRTQNLDLSESAQAEARRELNVLYDEFVAEFGPINTETRTVTRNGVVMVRKKNLQAFKRDPEWMKPAALEIYDVETDTAEKHAIFHRRVTRPRIEITECDTADAALLVTLDQKGYVDLANVGRLWGGASEEKVIEALGDRIFLNPDGLRWEMADAYLSGYVRKKLKVAQEAAQTDARFERNVTALEQVQPEDLPPSEVDAQLGAGWIASEDIRDFIEDLLGPVTKHANVEVAFNPLDAEWKVDCYPYLKSSVECTRTWGTERAHAIRLIEDSLNQRPTQIYDLVEERDPKSGRIREVSKKNVKESLDAQEKQSIIEDRFSEWVWQDPARAQRLIRIYNDTFNNVRLRVYDGSHLRLHGASDAITLDPHQKNGIWRILQEGNTLVAHVVGAGKAQPLDAKVLTPTGWKRMGDIQVGDQVIARDGRPTRVTGVFPQGEKDIYRIRFSDGSQTESCDEHLWLTQTQRERDYAGRAMKAGKDWPCGHAKVRPLSEIRASLTDERGRGNNHSIPMVEPVQFAARDLPLDPYLFGVLLGDGGFRASAPTLSTADPEIAASVEALLPDEVSLKKMIGDNYDYRITGPRAGPAALNPVTEALRDLKIFGLRSEEKLIPDEYLFNTVENRIALLQGLMDTDGTVDRRGTSVHFTSTSLSLAEGVAFLTQSLGGTVSWSEREPTYTHNDEVRTGRRAHTLTLNLPPEIIPFRLPRKADKVVPKSKYRPTRFITSVELVGRKQAQCIMVDHPDHLYVTDDFIITHNTFLSVAAGMEMKRLGLSAKNLYCVPNHMLEQFSREFLQLYPNANIICAATEDFSGDKRRLFLARIAAGEYDGVILTHSAFTKIPVSPQFEQNYIEEELARYEQLLEDAKKEGSRLAQKQLVQAKKRLEVNLRRLSNRNTKDTHLSWENLGVTAVFYDEAHKVKNLFVPSKIQGIPKPSKPSQRAQDMLMKAQYLDSQTPGRGLVFMTGTPVSNTIAEVYINLYFLAPRVLENAGLYHFDAWAGTFARRTNSLELAPDGATYRIRTRFRFCNVAELVRMFRIVADVQTAEMLQLPRPELDGPDNGYHIVQAPASDELTDYIQSLVDRAEKIRNGEVKADEDNMLAVTNDGRHAALDMRLIYPDLPPFPESKVYLCGRKILQEYHATRSFRGTQLVFCDLSTPKPGKWSVYQELRTFLVQGLPDEGLPGIPESEVAFIHEANNDIKKARMFKDMREGRIAVLLASTEKAGVGTNVQDRLIAMHHLDAPWRPADIEQREGRILRRGNMNKVVRIYRYVTEGSFDAYMWNTLQYKAEEIGKVVCGDVAIRRMDDIGSQALSFSQVKAAASGNPLVMEKYQVDADVMKLKQSHDAWKDRRISNRIKLANLPQDIATEKTRVERIRADVERRIDTTGDKFNITLGGRTFTERPDAADRLRQLITDALDSAPVDDFMPVEIGTFSGFDLVVCVRRYHRPELCLMGAMDYGIKLELRDSSPQGNLQALEHIPRRLDKKLEEHTAHLAYLEAQLVELEKLRDEPFPKQEELDRLLARQKELDQLLSKEDKEAKPVDYSSLEEATLDDEDEDSEEVAEAA